MKKITSAFFILAAMMNAAYAAGGQERSGSAADPDPGGYGELRCASANLQSGKTQWNISRCEDQHNICYTALDVNINISIPSLHCQPKSMSGEYGELHCATTNMPVDSGKGMISRCEDLQNTCYIVFDIKPSVPIIRFPSAPGISCLPKT